MKRFWLLIFQFLLSAQLFGQSANPQAIKANNGLKYAFGYFGHYKVTPKWGIHTDVQFRMDESLKFAFQTVLRAGLIRYLKPNLHLAGGYAVLNTYSESFGDYFTEHRLWEQLHYSHKTRHRTMGYRFRLEQRFVEKLKFAANGEAQTDAYHNGNRLRFMHRTIFDLTKNPEANDVFFIALQDEIFLNVASRELNRNLLDQNRFLVSFGVIKDKQTRLELGFAYIFLNPYKHDNTYVHGLVVGVTQNLDFSKPE
jgi:hypothetical protein